MDCELLCNGFFFTFFFVYLFIFLGWVILAREKYLTISLCVVVVVFTFLLC